MTDILFGPTEKDDIYFKPLSVQFSSVASCVLLFPIPWIVARQASLSITNSEFTQTHLHWIGDAIQPSHPLSSPSPPTFNLSQHQGLFQWVSSSRQVAKYWSFSFNISPSNEYSGLTSLRMDWLDLPALQGTLKSLLQHSSSKASILWHSAFFIVQLSHPYMTTGKTIALTRQTFVDKVTSLLFNMLSGLVITFLPRSMSLLISWLQSPSAVILEPRKIKSATVSTVSPSICHEVMGPDAMILELHFANSFASGEVGNLFPLNWQVYSHQENLWCLLWSYPVKRNIKTR